MSDAALIQEMLDTFSATAHRVAGEMMARVRSKNAEVACLANHDDITVDIAFGGVANGTPVEFYIVYNKPEFDMAVKTNENELDKSAAWYDLQRSVADYIGDWNLDEGENRLWGLDDVIEYLDLAPPPDMEVDTADMILVVLQYMAENTPFPFEKLEIE